MKFSGDFNVNEHYEYFEFIWNQTTSPKLLRLELVEVPFEHVLIHLRNPHKELVAQFTMKTRQKYLYFGELTAMLSNGATRTEIVEGAWVLEIIKPYQVGGRFEINIEEANTAPSHANTSIYTQDFSKVWNTLSRYYQGDIHLHSDSSDGRITYEKIAKEFERSGLDYLSHTEHSIATTHYPNIQAPIIPGVEITFDNFGHYNVYGYNGIIDYQPYFIKNDTKSDVLNDLFKHLSKEGHPISINHPFAKGIDLQHHIDMQYITHLEVINSPHLWEVETDNHKALLFFDFLWKNRICLIGVGGSDAHKENYYNKYPIGYPTTSIHCDGLSVNNLYDGLKQGKIIVTCYDDVEFEYKSSSGKIVHPLTRVDEGLYTMMGRSKTPIQWKVIVDGKIVHTHESCSLTHDIDLKSNSYVRVEGHRESDIILFTNPIMTFTKEANQSIDFLKLVEEFEKELD
ncbi:CehA/McbA family metallohydrolase [Erysipelothrix urinaevulpis]|uniref:CehA/McbA family metallohydrolase n=1 Tax=Erysipelothrix urinaevulpis TaxID=2683717 RepID=UPI001359725D|nr:CehA/McbA family metallohydrolase [Erysipelothrix urinaevulpis]